MRLIPFDGVVQYIAIVRGKEFLVFEYEGDFALNLHIKEQIFYDLFHEGGKEAVQEYVDLCHEFIKEYEAGRKND